MPEMRDDAREEGEVMNRTNLLGVACVLLFASCASVPRDAGFPEVQKVVEERTKQRVIVTAPSALDDPSVASMLRDELTADRAVEIAMANSPRLQVELAQLGIARAELIEANTIANPLFEAELRFPGDPYRPYELRLAQTLVDLIRLPRRRALGRAAFDIAQLEVSSSVLRFGADVRNSYYDAVAASQHLTAATTIVDAARAAADVAIRQHDAQNITDLDLENEQALYEQARLDHSRAERQLLVARERLAREMGLRDRSLALRIPAAFPELNAAEPDQSQLEAIAASQRLDLAIARRHLELAKAKIPLARLAAIGEITADVHYEREPDGSRTIGPGIEFPIPIFDNGRAARTRAEAEYLRAQHAVNTIAAESSSQLRAASITLTEARARVEYYRDVVLPRRRRIVELTKLEHNAMLAGVFQLLQARQNEAQAERDFIDAQREYWSARNNLDLVLQGIDGATSTEPMNSRRSESTARGSH
jgi:cobalt-zinc-cadmium efflux system outer membrane protein